MSTLLDSFAAAFDALVQPEAAALGASRRAALAALQRDGLPGPRSEAWKYTSLRALERRAFAVPTAPFWAEELAAIDDKRAQIRQMGHYLNSKHKDHANADGHMTGIDRCHTTNSVPIGKLQRSLGHGSRTSEMNVPRSHQAISGI